MSELKEIFTWISNNGVSTVLLFVGVYYVYRLLSKLLDIAKQAFLDSGGYVESYRNAANATVDLTSHIKEYDSRQLAMCEKHATSIDELTDNLVGGREVTHEKLDAIIASILEISDGINEAAEFAQPELKGIIKTYTNKLETILGR